jgi:hypothetical protein
MEFYFERLKANSLNRTSASRSAGSLDADDLGPIRQPHAGRVPKQHRQSFKFLSDRESDHNFHGKPLVFFIRQV